MCSSRVPAIFYVEVCFSSSFRHTEYISSCLDILVLVAKRVFSPERSLLLLTFFVLLLFSMLGDFGDEMDQTSSRMDSVLKKLEKVSHMTSSKFTTRRGTL